MPNDNHDEKGRFTFLESGGGSNTAGDQIKSAIQNAASDKQKNLLKLRDEFNSKSVDELVKMKKKLFSKMDITSAMSDEEKILNEVVAQKFSDINAQIRAKKNAR